MVNKTVTLRDSVSAIRPRVLHSANCVNESRVAKFSVRHRHSAFTLVELLISVGVLVLLVLLATQLLNSAATITTLGQKQMDANSQARQLLDRMAVDFGHMVRRSDLDYFAKNTTTPNSQGGPMAGNDQIAFYSNVTGYYPASGSPSPISLIAYRVNAQNRLERMGKGLVWSSVSNADPTSVVFLPLKIADTWPTAVNLNAPPTPAPDAEVVASQVFRFEYCYLLTDGTLSAVPPSGSAIAAIMVDIGIIDPKSKVLLNDSRVATFTTPGDPNFLSDYISGMRPGQLMAQWQNTLNGITSLPRPAISGIRLYERFFYLAPSTL